MGNLSPARDAILRALCEHPFLTRRHLELYLGFPERTVRHGLRELQTRKWVWRANARRPWMHARCLYAPTTSGIQAVSQNIDSPQVMNELRVGLSPARLDRLVLSMERVFQMHTIFLWLMSKQKTEAHRWRAVRWDVEVAKLFSVKGRGAWIPFHGAAIMQRGLRSDSAQGVSEKMVTQDARWAFVVVEFDLSHVAVERDAERLHQFVAAQDDPRYWGRDKEAFFPILVIIAQDELRLQDYYNVLRSAALARQLPMPRAYLATIRQVLTLRNDNALPIWYSTITGRQTALLFDTEGVTGPPPEQTLWSKLPLSQSGVGTSSAKDNGVAVAPRSNESVDVVPGLTQTGDRSTEHTQTLAQITLNLQPLEKRMLDEIAAHPLLTRSDIVVLLKASLRRVQPGLAKLVALKLVEQHKDKYLIAAKGQQYLAVTTGFGNAVQRYARARGWGKGFDVLMRHAEHTEQENKFFLHLAKIALTRKHRFTWLSELESRLYYEAGNRRHSFLPDGRGTYGSGKTRYEFAVEIDRSRSSQERIERKLAEYEACINSNVLRREGIELLRLLVLTISWERAETWCSAARSEHADYPIFITTFDRVYASGADSPIWLRADGSVSETAASASKVFCFECFAQILKLKQK